MKLPTTNTIRGTAQVVALASRLGAFTTNGRVPKGTSGIERDDD